MRISAICRGQNRVYAKEMNGRTSPFFMLNLLSIAIGLSVLLGLRPVFVGAHPLGNFTTNHLVRLAVRSGVVDLRYVLDMAEIPTVALDQTLDASGKPSAAQYAAWGRLHALEIVPQLDIDVDGARIVPALTRVSVATRAGAAGLRTVYLRADYHGTLPANATALVFHDRTELGRLGWKDVILAPTTDPTAELRHYPSALVGSPHARTALALQIDARGLARVTTDPADDAAPSAPPSVARMNALSDLLSQNGSGPTFLFGALLLAIGLGALHALEPGHGKTLLAVSLVGARATASQAVLLASALTVAHTAGVIALGAIVLFATRWIVPEAVYPWITLGSGMFVATLGARALATQLRRRRPVAHQHVHEHPHAQPHVHDHAHGLGVTEHDHAALDDEAHALAHTLPGTAPLTFRTAVLAAASGNLAPCPAALVVLLAAISLHRIALGMTLIVAFSIGLAATLTILGVAVVRSAAWLVARPQFDALARWAPFASAGAIAIVGAVMVGEGAVAQGIAAPLPIVAGLTLLAIVGYAFATPHKHLATRSSGA